MTDAPANRVKNHLEGQTSPYLLQHVYNPVDWYPWGAEALAKAAAEDKPIFLSIGYAACHWCHVMEHESFEDAGIAAYLNEHFVSIKVDREERPDLDDLYMAFVQRTTGAGGWPMTVFLTPERLPFWGGTYFPPEERFGRPGFPQVLAGIQDSWTRRRDEIAASAERVHGMLALDFPAVAVDAPLPDPATLDDAFANWVGALEEVHDRTHGGFGGAPKFPRAEDLRFLLLAADRLGERREASAAQEMATRTLHAMAAGGMYDQLGGGFARYAVDAEWRVPHFEKMLYDQGTLIPAYVEGWARSGDPRLEAVARATCDYLLRERQEPGGGFRSSSDADSEGVEGKFFAWTPEQLVATLGERRGAFAAALYGVRPGGNFEHGMSVLTLAMTPVDAARAAGLPEGDADALAEEVRATLYAARAERVPPGDDDKVLTGWNGLAIDALARAGREFAEPRWVDAADRAADFLLAELRVESDGGVAWRRAWRDGQARHRAVLEDLACLCRGLLALFQATGDATRLAQAEELGRGMLADFHDPESGLFWDTDGRDATLIRRLRTPWDGATPAANAVALECLALLHAFTQEPAWRTPLRHGAAALWPMAQENPRAFLGSARALAWAVTEPAVAVVVGAAPDEPVDAAWRVALRDTGMRDALPVIRAEAAADSALGLLHGRTAQDGPTLYLCREGTCAAPRAWPRGTH